eukprot:COSAG05_NODE_512_length_9090_cov_33.937827_4_plen_40_part_00
MHGELSVTEIRVKTPNSELRSTVILNFACILYGKKNDLL